MSDAGTGNWGIDININEAKATGKVSGSSGASMAGGVAKLAGGIGGVAALVAELVSMVKEAVGGVLKPIRTMAVGIMKVLAQLLRPITDMVVLLLMPILQFIRPIIKVFSDLMRPFRTAAYQLMRAAGKTSDPVQKGLLQSAAMTSLFAGLAVGLIGIMGELLKFLISLIAAMIGKIISYLTFGLVDAGKVAADIAGTVNGWIDSGVKAIATTAYDGVRIIANSLGVQLNSDIRNALKKGFGQNEFFGQQNTAVQQSASKSSGYVGNYYTTPGTMVNTNTQTFNDLFNDTRTIGQILAKAKYGIKTNGG